MDLNRYERVLGPLSVGMRRDLHVTRHAGRGDVSYVVHDPLRFENHAFRGIDYEIVCAIVPQRTLAEALDHLIERGVLDDDEHDRRGFYEFALWLHGEGLLQLPIHRPEALFERHRRKRAARRASILRAALSLRVPLLDPDRFLVRTQRYVGWIFSPVGIALWALLLGVVAWKCAGRFDELLDQSQSLLAIANLPILWVTLVVLKVLHEFGHGYACRRFGGAVPEMGVVFIFLTPCAYVDATSSWKFDRRRHRLAVALAGMYVESIVAAVFALIWAGTQAGLMHDVALNVVVLASVTTVLLNINPLMKFDGYYVFSDLLGVFNLQERSFAHLERWSGRVFLGRRSDEPGYTAREHLIYGLYGPSAFLYRAVLAFTITALVLMSWPSAGLILGAVFFTALFVQPLLRLFRYLWTSDETAAVRPRARMVAVGLVAALPLAGFLPVSTTVAAPGVLEPFERQAVRAPEDGFAVDVTAHNGLRVRPSEVLGVLANPAVELRRLRLVGELRAERLRFSAVELGDTTQAQSHRTRIAYLQSAVAEIDARLASMSIRSKAAGTVALPGDWSWQGRFFRRGDELFQVHSDRHLIRVVLTDYQVSRARLEVGSTAEIRWACDPGHPVLGVVREIRAAASRRDLPEQLTVFAGGEVYLQPRRGAGPEADQPYLHVFVESETLPLAGQGAGLTARVRVPARVELLGAWVKRKLLSFVNAWRMS